MLDDLLLLAGLGCLAYAAFLVDERLGFAVTGVGLILLSLAARDVKIRLPRPKFKGRPWRS